MTIQNCKINNCKSNVFCKELCSTHYSRLRKHCNPLTILRNQNGNGYHGRNGSIYLYKPNHPNAMKNGRILEHYYIMSEHINRKIEKNEYIEHIDGNRSNNKIENLILKLKLTACNVDNCNNKIKRLSFCHKHYRRYLKYGDPTKLFLNKSETGYCIIEDCNKKHDSKGYCVKHYLRFKRTGSAFLQVKERKDIINARGYKLCYFPTHENSNAHGYVLEHRLVMSNYINRPLFDYENVHHKNGNKLDNNLDNLELWSTSQPAGQRIEDKIKWANEILEIYKNSPFIN